jgi:choline dehydrogenase
VSDYVVVGAGTAGCVLANRLTEDGTRTVTLLEAGGADARMEIKIPAAFSKLFKSDVDWNYETAPQEHMGGRTIYWPRGKVLGGSSSMNAMMVVPGVRADYDGWAALGAAGWSWDDVEPYLRRADAVLPPVDLRDPSPLSRAFVAAAADAGVEATLTRVWQRRGRRWSAADGYLRPALKRRNLELVTGAHATRVVVDDVHATGVAYRTGGEERVAQAEREVVLCGGTVNSPQLLLLSGIGPAVHLRKHGLDVRVDLPGVGRNLQDHLAAGIWVASRRPITLLVAESKPNVARWVLARRGMLTSNVAEAYAFVATRAELAAPDLELIFAPVMFVEGGLEPPPEHGITIGCIALQPRSRGVVELGSPDPLEAPVIQPNYLSDPDDLRVLLHGVHLARLIAAAPPLATWLGDELPPGRDAHTDDEIAALIREKAHTLYHPVGTCRMGSDELAVVDPELRVRGVRGLRVVDASVMPAVIRGHTNAPTLMIAEKAADLIRGAVAAPEPEAVAL